MLPFVVFSLFAIGATAILFDDDTDNETDDVEHDDIYRVNGDDTIVANDGDDVFLRDLDAENYDNVSIDAGAGNDTLALFDPVAEADVNPFSDPVLFGRATIDAGAGNDLVDIVAQSSELRGGDGDDTISAYGFAGGTDIYGEAGNDVLYVEARSGDAVLIDGGEGEDTIDARMVDNATVLGGDGDDVIYLPVGTDNNGTGYTLLFDAGEGDDTIHHEAGSYLDRFNRFDTFGEIRGGEGSDTFALKVNEGDRDFPDQEELLELDRPLISLVDGVIRLEGVTLHDYDPELDTLEIDASSVSDEFELTTARLETSLDPDDDSVTSTSLVLRYVATSGDVRDVEIKLGAADVTLDDIDFVGEETPTLIAVA